MLLTGNDCSLGLIAEKLALTLLQCSHFLTMLATSESRPCQQYLPATSVCCCPGRTKVSTQAVLVLNQLQALLRLGHYPEGAIR
jgi:hypothetical protein